ncbi:serine hydrolase [Lewinella sp. W8]|uniref:serine hydrolase domain-containing protein n=1 Tax=Lewinella sp. W8 TaxID=2528208 RepID=UPI0015668A0F|nr:serine hydrolase domain-containing protein [Lewinella sp. W8]
MRNLFLFPVFLLVALLCLTSCDDDNITTPAEPPIRTSADLSAALTKIQSNADAPGFGVSVVKDDVLLYQQSFGMADIDANRPYTNQTIQPIGSISKTFVAAAVVKAIEQGYFTLDTDINDVLPLPIINPKRPDDIIRVRHLVTHTSGLLDEEDTYTQAYHILPGEDTSSPGAQLLQGALGIEQRATLPLEDFLADYYLPEGGLYSPDNFANTAPGTTWSYSNIATSLMAYLVEIATETSFEQYVTENILTPLAMEQSGYQVAPFAPGQLAQLYWDPGTPLPRYANESYPDGSLLTSNEQLAAFLTDMMRGARGESGILFNPSGYQMLFSALLPPGMVPTDLGENQGIFWFHSGNIIRHDGSDPGTTCNLEFRTDGTAGYLLLTNMDASTSDHAAAYFDLAQRVDDAVSEFLAAN